MKDSKRETLITNPPSYKVDLLTDILFDERQHVLKLNLKRINWTTFRKCLNIINIMSHPIAPAFEGNFPTFFSFLFAAGLFMF